MSKEPSKNIRSNYIVDYYQELWIIESTLLDAEFPQCGKCLRTMACNHKIWVKQIIPVYVYSLNEHWDSKWGFDICPVDFSKKENREISWRWKREYDPETIGEDIWFTKKEAQAVFNKKYSPVERKLYARELKRANETTPAKPKSKDKD